MRAASLSVALGVTVAGLLVACSPGRTSSSTTVTAAPDAGTPACVTALAAAPATVAGLARTPVSVTGALSWGEPAVVLRCGLPSQAPTTKSCLGIDATGTTGTTGTVDWIVDAEGDPFVFVSYGRVPAVELRVPASYGRDDAVAAVTDVSPVAAALPRNGRSCIGPGDTTGTTGTTVSATRSGG